MVPVKHVVSRRLWTALSALRGTGPQVSCEHQLRTLQFLPHQSYSLNHHAILLSVSRPLSYVTHTNILPLPHQKLESLSPNVVSICMPSRRAFATESPGNKEAASVENEQRVEEDEDEEAIIPTKDEHGKPLSNWQRMKIMAKTYGYVIIPVHWVIAPVWFGSFYYAIKMGIDIEPMLHQIGVSDHHIETLKNSRASTALMAYALYKIFTPLRYTLTLAATEFTIRFLRRRGFIKPVPKKEKSYRQSLKETYSEVKDRLKKEEAQS